jgi:hypothetical protein
MSAVARLREAGLRLMARGDTLIVEPRSALTDELRAVIRENKPAILRELASETSKAFATRRSAAVSAGPGMSDFGAALVLGRLHVCCNCRHFEFADEPSALGHCRQLGVESWPFVPFWCARFEASKTPVAPIFLHDPAGALACAKECAK